MSFSDNINSDERLKGRLESYSRPAPEHLWNKISAEINADDKRPTGLLWLYLLLPLLFAAGYFVGRETTKAERHSSYQQYSAYSIVDSSIEANRDNARLINNILPTKRRNNSDRELALRHVANDSALLIEVKAMSERLDKLESELANERQVNKEGQKSLRNAYVNPRVGNSNSTGASNYKSNGRNEFVPTSIAGDHAHTDYRSDKRDEKFFEPFTMEQSKIAKDSLHVPSVTQNRQADPTTVAKLDSIEKKDTLEVEEKKPMEVKEKKEKKMKPEFKRWAVETSFSYAKTFRNLTSQDPEDVFYKERIKNDKAVHKPIFSLAVHYKISPYLGFKLGLVSGSLGENFNITKDSVVTVNGGYGNSSYTNKESLFNFNTKKTFVGIPVILEATLPLYERLSLELGVGGTYNIITSASSVVKVGSSNYALVNWGKDNSIYNKNAWSLSSDIKLLYHINDTYDLSLGGVLNYYTNPITRSIECIQERPYYYGINVGVRMKFR